MSSPAIGFPAPNVRTAAKMRPTCGDYPGHRQRPFVGCGKRRDLEKTAMNKRDTGITVSSDQWVTDVSQSMGGSETTIDRLFPQPARPDVR